MNFEKAQNTEVHPREVKTTDENTRMVDVDCTDHHRRKCGNFGIGMAEHLSGNFGIRMAKHLSS